jgi:Concanavalin A-like lectin/glucanases superfamily
MGRNRRNNAIVVAIITLLAEGSCFVTVAKPQSSVGKEVGLWHLDEVIPAEYRSVTPDATGANPGTLIHAPADPVLVEGKFGKALRFDGQNGVYVPIRFLVGFPPSPEPVYIPVSTTLDVKKDIKIEAWINVQAFKDVTYNNIVVKCSRTDASSENTTRVYGLAIKAGIPENGHSIPMGALSGCVFTDTEGFNEIVTSSSVVPLNQWVHIAFLRSQATGMHLYLNGVEQSVEAIYGTQNPRGRIINGTEVYFGHDAEVTMDEVQISDLSPEADTLTSSIDIGPNMMIALIAVAAIIAVAMVLRRAIQMWTIRGKP